MKIRKEQVIYVFMTLLLFLGLHVSRSSSIKKISKEVAYHAEAVSTYAWNLDYEGIKQYLMQAIASNQYSRVTYYDNVTGNMELDLNGPALTGFDALIQKLNLLQELEISHSVTRNNGEELGMLHIFYANKRIYIYSYIFNIYILIQFILFLIIRLNRERSGLEVRVRERTEELEREIEYRKNIQEDLRLTLDSIGDGVIILDLEKKIRGMNPVAEKLTEWTQSEAEGKPIDLVYNLKHSKPLVDQIIKTGSVIRSDRNTILVSRSGQEYQVSESGAPIETADGTITGVVLVIRDITAEYKLQTQLEHSQRLDAIGQLAGGVAHDFNNILGGIMGFSELLQEYIPDEPEPMEINRMIIDACTRASGLTTKLLAFSRKGKTSSTSIHFTHLLNETIVLLRRTLDRRIEITLDSRAAYDHINGDETMLQNAIINLAINASHAMPEGGPLLIQTSNLSLDSNYCSSSTFDLEPGDYLELKIEDKGCGIPREALTKIFEPFYTTKEQGKGTGLGLAAVYGTVQQHNGEIKVYSEVGIGTSFNVLLPLNEGTDRKSHAAEITDFRGSGTILLVDDEEMIRKPVGKMLELLGYTVLLAENGKEAVDRFERERSIDLVILDMIMPEMNGKDCFLRLREINPYIPVILASGFSETEDIKTLRENGLNAFITKPFRQNQIAQLIHKILG